MVIAAVIVYRLVGPRLPKDHDVVYELGDMAPALLRLDVFWNDPERPRETPVYSSTWHFSEGRAPRRLPSTVKLYEGKWDIEARLELASREPVHVSRKVNLGEGTTIIRLGGTLSRESSPPRPHD